MKIMHVTTHANRGGISQYILSLCAAMRSMGFDSIVASSGGNMESDFSDSRIPHTYVDIKTKFEFGPKVFKGSSRLKHIIKEEGVDIVHAHTRVSQVASYLASRKTNAHYLSTCHGFFKTRLSRKIFDFWGERVVAISAPVKSHLEKDFGVSNDRIELIHNGIDLSRFSQEFSSEDILRAKEYLGIENGPVIGTMGRLSSVKGQRFLIEAMKYIVLSDNRVKCVIIGSGPEEGELKKLVMKMGLEGSVKFAGDAHYKDAPLYLKCMDIFVLPSLKEGLGLALLEAMALGKPCIASDVGGISEILGNGQNGLSVPPANAEALKEAIMKLLNDRSLSAGLAGNGRALVREKFSIESMAGKMAAMYRKIIDGKE